MSNIFDYDFGFSNPLTGSFSAIQAPITDGFSPSEMGGTSGANPLTVCFPNSGQCAGPGTATAGGGATGGGTSTTAGSSPNPGAGTAGADPTSSGCSYEVFGICLTRIFVIILGFIFVGIGLDLFKTVAR
jgi:hypothetical protein